MSNVLPTFTELNINNNIIEENYTMIKDLGEGTFSLVKLARHKLTGEKVN